MVCQLNFDMGIIIGATFENVKINGIEISELRQAVFQRIETQT